MQWCLTEILPMTLSSSFLSYHSSSSPISLYGLCGLSLKNLQHRPHSFMSNPISFGDINLCLALLPLFSSLTTVFAESQNEWFHYNTWVFYSYFFFSHCSSSHVHVHLLSSSIHLRLESLIDRELIGILYYI